VYLCPQIFSHKEHEDCFRCDPKKGLNCVFLQTLDGIFWSQAALGTMFAWIFKDFAKIFNKSKLLGVRLHLLNPHLLHHWLTCHYFVLVLVFVTTALIIKKSKILLQIATRLFYRDTSQLWWSSTLFKFEDLRFRTNPCISAVSQLQMQWIFIHTVQHWNMMSTALLYHLLWYVL